MKTFLFDTNVLVAIIRNENAREKFYSQYSFNINQATTSVVVQGELESLSLQFGWGRKHRIRMDQLFHDLVILPIKARSIIESYAQIDAYSQRKLIGRPLPSGMTSRNMGKNDLWIAATAYAAGATLVTTDNDFDHLKNDFIKLDWVDVQAFL